MTETTKQKPVIISSEEEAPEVAPTPTLTPEDVQRLRHAANAFQADRWRATTNGTIVNIFDYVVAEMAHASDARALASFEPYVLHQLLDLAEKALDMEPTLR